MLKKITWKLLKELERERREEGGFWSARCDSINVGDDVWAQKGLNLRYPLEKLPKQNIACVVVRKFKILFKLEQNLYGRSSIDAFNLR